MKGARSVQKAYCSAWLPQNSSRENWGPRSTWGATGCLKPSKVSRTSWSMRSNRSSLIQRPRGDLEAPARLVRVDLAVRVLASGLAPQVRHRDLGPRHEPIRVRGVLEQDPEHQTTPSAVAADSHLSTYSRCPTDEATSRTAATGSATPAAVISARSS